MLAIHVDIANLPRVLRYDVGYGAGQERVRRTAPELEIGRGSDPQCVPIDRPGTGGPGPELVEGRLALPKESEGESCARRPLAEEDFRRLEGLQVERLRDDRLAHRPDLIELEGHGTPHRLDCDVDVRNLEGPVDDVSETLAEGSAALGEDEQAFRRRRGVPFQQPPPEPVEDRAVRGLRADVVQRSTPRDRLELFQEFVVPPQLPQGVEQFRMSPRPTLGEPPQGAFDNRLADLPDRPEARVQIVLGEEGLLGGDLLHRMCRADGTEATAFSDLARVASAVGEEHATVARVLRVGSGVEQVAPQEGREGEYEGMARTEQVDRLRRIEAFLRRNDDADQIPEPVCLQERNDASDRANRHIEGRHRSRAALAQVGVEAALDGADEGHVAAKGDRLLRAADSFVDVLRGAPVI